MRARLFGNGRRASVTVTAAALVLGLVVLLIVLPSGSGTPASGRTAAAPSGTATASPTATPGSTTPEATASGPAASAQPTAAGLDPEQSRRDAEAALRSFLTLSDETYRAADGELAAGLTDVATGFALGEVQATATEFKDTGGRQTGSVEVSDLAVETVDLGVEPPTVTITACLDTTDVDVLNIDGTSAKQGRPVTTSKTLHIFGVQYADVWRVATHSFPDNANCS